MEPNQTHKLLHSKGNHIKATCFPLDGEDLILDTSHALKSYLK